MVDFVEGDDGGEFDGDEGRDDGGDGVGGPGFERLFEGQGVERAGDDGGGGAVAGELRLEGVDGGDFDGDVAAFEGAPLCFKLLGTVGDFQMALVVGGSKSRYHFCIRLPRIQLTISERSQTMS